MKKWMKKVTAFILTVSMVLTGVLAIAPVPEAEAAPGDVDFKDGSYYLQLSKSGKYVGVTSVEEGAEAVLTDKPFLWDIRHRNGHIQLSPHNSDLTLEVQNSSLNEWGAKIQLYRNDEGYACKEIQAVFSGKDAKGRDTVYLRFEHSGFVADVQWGQIYTNGTPLWQYRCHSPRVSESDSQKFLLTPVEVSKPLNSVQQTVYKKALATQGDDGYNYQRYFGGLYGQPWCAMFVVHNLQTSLSENGYSNSQIKSIVPTIASTTQLAKWYNDKGRYESFTNWSYNGLTLYKNSSNQYTPKVGDIALVETSGGVQDGPDHSILVVKVNNDGSFVSMEGNAGSPGRVRSYTYVKSGNTWARSNAPSVIVHGICDVAI